MHSEEDILIRRPEEIIQEVSALIIFSDLLKKLFLRSFFFKNNGSEINYLALIKL